MAPAMRKLRQQEEGPSELPRVLSNADLLGMRQVVASASFKSGKASQYRFWTGFV